MNLKMEYDPYQIGYDLQNIGTQMRKHKQETSEKIQSAGVIAKSLFDVYQTGKDAEITNKILSGDYIYSAEHAKANPFKKMFMSPDKALESKKIAESIDFGGKSIPLPEDASDIKTTFKSISSPNVKDVFKDKLSGLFGKSKPAENIVSKGAEKVMADTTSKEASKLAPGIGIGISAMNFFDNKYRNKADRTKGAINLATDVAGLALPGVGWAKGAYNLMKMLK